MGNEQSATTTPAEMKSRHSVDANFLRQVTPRGTPRVSVAGCSRLPAAPQNSDSDGAPNLLHRLSTDCAELKYFKPKLSLSGEEMGNQQGRRLSRAANQMEATGDGGLSLVDSAKLSNYQIQLIQNSWQKLKMNQAVFAQGFKLLCFKSTTAREMFQKMSIVEGFRSNQTCDLNTHAKVLFELLDSLMNDLGQSGKIVQARCMDIGASHVNMNEKCCGSLWDSFGECLAEVITKQDCIRPKRECSKAWISLISFLVDGMKCGYMDEWKRKQSGRLNQQSHHQPQIVVENGAGASTSSSHSYAQPCSSNGSSHSYGGEAQSSSFNGGYGGPSHY